MDTNEPTNVDPRPLNERVEDRPPEIGAEAGLEEINRSKLVDYFNMDRPNFEESKLLNQLHDWATSTGAQTPGEIMMAIKRLEMKLGAPPTGENRLRRLVNYVAIDKQLDALFMEQASYVNKGGGS